MALCATYSAACVHRKNRPAAQLSWRAARPTHAIDPEERLQTIAAATGAEAGAQPSDKKKSSLGHTPCSALLPPPLIVNRLAGPVPAGMQFRSIHVLVVPHARSRWVGIVWSRSLTGTYES
jgi:hypothetical protein